MSTQSTARLTIVLLAYREGQDLQRCLNSLNPLVERTGASTLIILDSHADATTEQVARQSADRVIKARFENFSRQRNIGLDNSTTEWVFFIDPDERMTVPLAQEIGSVIADREYAAHRVPRRNILFGHEVRHTGWSPDYQIRLLQRTRCRYDESRAVHELPQVDGVIGTLAQPLIHYNYRSWGQFIAKQQHYAPLEAAALFAQGHRAGWRSLLGQPVREFKRRYVDYKGYKDGLLGLKLSLAMALYKLLVYRHLRQLPRK